MDIVPFFFEEGVDTIKGIELRVFVKE